MGGLATSLAVGVTGGGAQPLALVAGDGRVGVVGGRADVGVGAVLGVRACPLPGGAGDAAVGVGQARGQFGADGGVRGVEGDGSGFIEVVDVDGDGEGGASAVGVGGGDADLVAGLGLVVGDGLDLDLARGGVEIERGGVGSAEGIREVVAVAVGGGGNHGADGVAGAGILVHAAGGGVRAKGRCVVRVGGGLGDIGPGAGSGAAGGADPVVPGGARCESAVFVGGGRGAGDGGEVGPGVGSVGGGLELVAGHGGAGVGGGRGRPGEVNGQASVFGGAQGGRGRGGRQLDDGDGDRASDRGVIAATGDVVDGGGSVRGVVDLIVNTGDGYGLAVAPVGSSEVQPGGRYGGDIVVAAGDQNAYRGGGLASQCDGVVGGAPDAAGFGDGNGVGGEH